MLNITLITFIINNMNVHKSWRPSAKTIAKHNIITLMLNIAHAYLCTIIYTNNCESVHECVCACMYISLLLYFVYWAKRAPRWEAARARLNISDSPTSILVSKCLQHYTLNTTHSDPTTPRRRNRSLTLIGRTKSGGWQITQLNVAKPTARAEKQWLTNICDFLCCIMHER